MSTTTTVNITVTNGSIYYRIVIFVVDWFEKSRGSGNGGFLLFIGDGTRLSAAVITIGVERKIKNHERF